MVTLAPFIVLIGLTIISIQENHILDNAYDLSLKTWRWLHNHENKRVSSEAIPIYKSPVHFERYQYFSIQKETAYLRWHRSNSGARKKKVQTKISLWGM